MSEVPTPNTTMDKVGNVFSNMLNNKWTIFYILLASAVFIGIVYYVYQNYIKSQLNNSYTDNRELVNEEAGKEEKVATLFLFKTDWCPHCKKILEPISDNSPEGGAWIQIKNKKKLKFINDYTVNFIEINGDDEDTMKAWEKKYLEEQGKSIDGYPSIYLIKDDQVIEFDANPTVESLERFLETVI